MTNAEDAGKLGKTIDVLRKDGVKEIQLEMQRPQPVGTPPIPFQDLINLINGIQVQSQADTVQVEVPVPNSLLRQLPLLVMPRRPQFDRSLGARGANPPLLRPLTFHETR